MFETIGLSDRIDDLLEERYGHRYSLHPARPKRHVTANREDDGLFGGATAVTDDAATEVAESCGAPEAAADAEAEIAEGREPPKPPNLK